MPCTTLDTLAEKSRLTAHLLNSSDCLTQGPMLLDESITLLMISKRCRGWCRFERQAEAHLDERTEKVVTMGKRAEGDNFEYLSAVDRSQHVSDVPDLR